MRRHPTIAFLRKMILAPMLAAPWAVTTGTSRKDLEEIKTQTYNDLQILKTEYLRNTVRGLLDWGWQPFELIHSYLDGRWTIERLRPLLQQYSDILIDSLGRVVGVRNMLPNSVANSQFTGPNPWVDLYWGEAVVITYDVEGDDHYGEPLMMPVETPYDSWAECETGARRFDKKVAGAHWVISYPVGTSPYNGVETDNSKIADDLGRILTANGVISIPQNILRQIEDLNGIDPTKQAWKIELISASTQQSSFIDRLRYIDSLMSRGLGFPERAVLEGQFGTKAEAEAHADFAVDALEQLHQDIVRKFNTGVVNFYLSVNYGEEYIDKIQFQAQPLNDNSRAMLREMYRQRLQDPNGGAAIEDEMIDWDAVRDVLSVPVKTSSVAHDNVTRKAITTTEAGGGRADPAAQTDNTVGPPNDNSDLGRDGSPSQRSMVRNQRRNASR